MAPSHLHPRSRMTSSLFATTVLASFFVVALPHVLPCPAPPRVAYADAPSEEVITITNPDGTTTTMTKKRRRRRLLRKPAGAGAEAEVWDGIAAFEARDEDFLLAKRDKESDGGDNDGGGDGDGDGEERLIIPKRARRRGPGERERERECPVPKPGGVIGELMGFGKINSSDPKNDTSSSNSSNRNRNRGGGGGDET